LSKTLDIETFGKVIRKIWPKFFILLSVLGLGSIAASYLETNSMYLLSISIFTFVACFLCYAIIPATNRASDNGDKKRFNLLHKTSVYLTVAVLLLNIVYLFL
jgi:heme/copper-type cytochrome/quinol oxidase subunit 2